MEAPEWDPPHYVNTQYPWDGREALQAPQVSEVYNPTVTCIRHFALSLPQVQQHTVLHLAGVEAAVLVYVNGHEVGYAEDSFTPHRFDLTPYVHVGENRLALRVFKRCTGSWMEDQDFWRFSGIHRSVSLHFYPETHLYDLRVRTPLTDNYTRATLETRLRVMGASLGKAKLTLTDKAGKTLWVTEKTADGAGKLRQRGDSRREAVERGRAESLHADRRADECAGASDRSLPDESGLPPVRDEGQNHVPEWQAHRVPRRSTATNLTATAGA